jgi:hypothetical protein
VILSGVAAFKYRTSLAQIHTNPTIANALIYHIEVYILL